MHTHIVANVTMFFIIRMTIYSRLKPNHNFLYICIFELGNEYFLKIYWGNIHSSRRKTKPKDMRPSRAEGKKKI